MKKLLIILFMFSCNTSLHISQSARETAIVFFHAENESGIRFYVLQQSDNTSDWKSIREVPAKGGGDYQFEIPYQAGFYRLQIKEDWGDRYSWVVSLK